jgi:hypothetical protein
MPYWPNSKINKYATTTDLGHSQLQSKKEYGFDMHHNNDHQAIQNRYPSLEESKFGSLIEQEDPIVKYNFSYNLLDLDETRINRKRIHQPAVTLKSFVCKTFGFDPVQKEELLVAGLKKRIDEICRQKKLYKEELKKVKSENWVLREKETHEKTRVVKAMRVFESKIKSISNEKEVFQWRLTKKRLSLEEMLKNINMKLLSFAQESTRNLSDHLVKRKNKTELTESFEKICGPNVESEWVDNSYMTIRTNLSEHKNTNLTNKFLRKSSFVPPETSFLKNRKFSNFRLKINKNLNTKSNLRNKILNKKAKPQIKKKILKMSLQKKLKVQSNPFIKNPNIKSNTDMTNSRIVQSLWINSKKGSHSEITKRIP